MNPRKRRLRRTRRSSLNKPGKYTKKAIERLHAMRMKNPEYKHQYLKGLGFSDREIESGLLGRPQHGALMGIGVHYK